MLGYTFVGLGLLVDLGRYYNIWHPILPSMWQGNSVLFEVGLCVMCYLTVLYIEFIPVLCERFMGNGRFPRLSRVCTAIHRRLEKVMLLFILAGVVLSCLHQSSLGNLMVVAPTKVHPLWYSPIVSLLFLLSAIAGGFPMVIVESLYAAWALRLKPEMELLGRLARIIPGILRVYLASKVGDLVIRETYVHLGDGSAASVLFSLEVLLGVVTPMVMLLMPHVRQTPSLLFISAMLIVLGVALNRLNVFLVAYQPPYATRNYFPSLGEFVVTAGMIAGLMLAYRVIVSYFPVIGCPAEGKGT
jgi:Ni/Fe-hydrogenase subunit HybB-like protein